MQANNSLTVIIPTYNGESFLEDQIESIVNQLMPEDKILCLDDFSTDNTRRCLEKLSEKYKLLSYTSNSINLGPNYTVWKLLHMVDTALFVFCDQDDVWLPGRLDSVRKCQKGEISVVGYLPFANGVNSLKPILPSSFNCGLIRVFAKPVIPGCVIGGWTDTVKNLFPVWNIKSIYDQFILFQVNLRGVNIIRDPEVRVLYRRHEGTVTRMGFAPNGLLEAIKRRFNLMEDVFRAIFK
jgi:glycosyltransferase involved in cell wall biosynthesis